MNFEVGKTYHTVGGHIILIRPYGDDCFIGHQQTNEPFSSMRLIYRLDGTPVGTGWDNFKLVPGAIESVRLVADGAHIRLDVERDRIDDLKIEMTRARDLIGAQQARTKAIEAELAKIKINVDRAHDRVTHEVRAAGLAEQARATAKAIEDHHFGTPPKPVRRKLYRIAYDGFEGYLIGRYTTIMGEPGVVLQMPDTGIVHVYKAKHIEGQ